MVKLDVVHLIDMRIYRAEEDETLSKGIFVCRDSNKETVHATT